MFPIDACRPVRIQNEVSECDSLLSHHSDRSARAYGSIGVLSCAPRRGCLAEITACCAAWRTRMLRTFRCGVHAFPQPKHRVPYTQRKGECTPYSVGSLGKDLYWKEYSIHCGRRSKATPFVLIDESCKSPPQALSIGSTTVA